MAISSFLLLFLIAICSTAPSALGITRRNSFRPRVIRSQQLLLERFPIVRGGSNDVLNVDGEEFFDAVQEDEKKKRRVTKKKKKKKRNVDSGASSTSTKSVDVGQEEDTSILPIVSGIVTTLFNLIMALFASFLDLISPSESAPKVTSQKATGRVQNTMERLGITNSKSILTGSFRKALSTARKRAKLLVALTSLNEDDIQLMAQLQPHIRQTYVLWIGPATPPLRSSRLYVYAGKTEVAASNPPRTVESTVTWLNGLRERHSAIADNLAKARQEVVWAKERTAGYHSSVKSDVQRRQEAAERKRAEEAARIQAEERAAALVERRQALLAALPDEPASGTEAVTVALRFADGTTGQRRFPKDDTTPLQSLFDWVDGEFAMERETVQLQTLNGSHTLRYNQDKDTPLESLKKTMIAFRVTLVKAEETESETSVGSDEL